MKLHFGLTTLAAATTVALATAGTPDNVSSRLMIHVSYE